MCTCVSLLRQQLRLTSNSRSVRPENDVEFRQANDIHAHADADADASANEDRVEAQPVDIRRVSECSGEAKGRQERDLD